MAMTCVNGARECTGCMRCEAERKVVGPCAECIGDVYADETYYKLDDGNTLVHEDCLLDYLTDFKVN